MDGSNMFHCTVIHPRLFPGPILNPGNPLKVELLVEVGDEDLKIRASAGKAKGKLMGTEPFSNIEQVTVKHIDKSAQRIEILWHSMLRMAIVVGIVLVFIYFTRPYSVGLNLLIALLIAVITGFLNFLLNGGLGRKQNIVRFHFELNDYHRGFSLEIPSIQESGLHQALLAAGLSLIETGTDQ